MLSSIITENTNLTVYKDYETKVPIELSIEIAQNFFFSIKSECASILFGLILF